MVGPLGNTLGNRPQGRRGRVILGIVHRPIDFHIRSRCIQQSQPPSIVMPPTLLFPGNDVCHEIAARVLEKGELGGEHALDNRDVERSASVHLIESTVTHFDAPPEISGRAYRRDINRAARRVAPL